MKFRAILCILTLLLPLYGCAAANEGEELVEHAASAAMANCPVMTVYYPDGAGGLLPVCRTIPYQEHMAAAVLSRLCTPPEGLTGAVPAGTGFSVEQGEDGTAVVNITGICAFETPLAEQAAVDCIVETALDLPDVEQVELRFDGEKLVQLKNGTAVGGAFTGAHTNMGTD